MPCESFFACSICSGDIRPRPFGAEAVHVARQNARARAEIEHALLQSNGLAAVDSLVFYINNITMCFDPVRMTDRVRLVLFYLQRFIQKAPSTPVNEIS